jgi:hypothetical protein
MWYQCDECIVGSNSKRNIVNHAEETGHSWTEDFGEDLEAEL